MEADATLDVPQQQRDSTGEPAKPRRRKKKVARAPGEETVPMQTVIAVKQQLEDLEGSYREQMAEQERMVRRLKSKLKKQKAQIENAQQVAVDAAASEPMGSEADVGAQLKKANLEILGLRRELEGRDKECLKLREALRSAKKESDSVVSAPPSLMRKGTKTLGPTVSGSDVPPSPESSTVEAPMLQDTQSVLDLSHRRTGFSPAYFGELSELMSSSNALRSVNFSFTKLGTKGATMLGGALKGQNSIQAVTLERCSISDSGIVAFADGLAHNRNITLLSLKSNRCGVTGAKALATAVQNHVSLASLDVSQCQIRPDGCSAIAAASCTAPNLSYLALSGNDMSAAGIKSLAAGLVSSSLTSLDVDGCKAPEESLVALFEVVPKSPLSFLNVSRNQCGGTGAMGSLASTLKHPSCKLEEIVLVGCGLQDDSSALVCAALGSADSLHNVSLWGAVLGKAGASALSAALPQSSLVVLDIRGTSLGIEGVQILARGIATASSLVSMDVSGNNLGAKGAAALAAAVSKSVSLGTLLANGNNFGNEGIKALAVGLKEATALRELSLQLNFLDDNGMENVSLLLANVPALTSLDLAFNHIGAAGLREIVASLGRLESLSLEGNVIGGEGAQLLEDSVSRMVHLNLSLNNLRQEGARAIGRLLQKCQLQQLDLRKNGFDSEGAVVISGALRLNQTLTSLDLSENRIAERGAALLAESLQLCRKLKLLDVSKNPLGEEGEASLRKAEKTVIFESD